MVAVQRLTSPSASAAATAGTSASVNGRSSTAASARAGAGSGIGSIADRGYHRRLAASRHPVLWISPADTDLTAGSSGRFAERLAGEASVTLKALEVWRLNERAP